MLLSILANNNLTGPSVQVSVSNEIIERVSEVKSGLSKSALLLVLTSTFALGTQPGGVKASSFIDAEAFVKEQRAHLNGALFVAGLDIPANARRRAETLEPEVFVKEQRGALNGAYFVAPYAPSTDVLIWARRNQACTEPEVFDKAQRASLLGAQQVTYYAKNDLGIQAKRHQETFEPEVFVKERRPNLNAELYGQFSASADLTAYFRRNQTCWEPETFWREQRGSLNGAFQVPSPFVAANDLAIFFKRAQSTWDSEVFPQALPVALQGLINGIAAPIVPVVTPTVGHPGTLKLSKPRQPRIRPRSSRELERALFAQADEFANPAFTRPVTPARTIVDIRPPSKPTAVKVTVRYDAEIAAILWMLM